MKRIIVSLFLMLMLTGCGQQDAAEPVLAEPEADKAVAANGDLLIGKKAYQALCGGCHDEGFDGAPRTGDREAWVDRSWLWESVLFEHAREGYEKMPAKGGDAALDELTVTKAAEYMMAVTYPELPRG